MDKLNSLIKSTEEKLAKLMAEREARIADINAYNGAILVTEQFLAELRDNGESQDTKSEAEEKEA